MNNYHKIFILILLLFLVLPAGQVFAEDEIIVSWKSDGFVPYFYQGKILPVKSGKITAGLELVSNDSLVNLDGKEIRWMVDRELITKGVGKKTVDFTVDNLTNDNILLRVIIKNFRGADLEKSVVIPVVRPEVVIDRISSEFKFRAWPFFFNISEEDLIFSWSANGRQADGAKEKPFLLELIADTNFVRSLGVKVTAQSRFDPLKMAKDLFLIKL